MFFVKYFYFSAFILKDIMITATANAAYNGCLLLLLVIKFKTCISLLPVAA